VAWLADGGLTNANVAQIHSAELGAMDWQHAVHGAQPPRYDSLIQMQRALNFWQVSAVRATAGNAGAARR